MKRCLFLYNSMSPFSRKKVYGGECRCNSAFALPDHEGVGVVVLSHLYHRLIQLQMREQWRAAWGHVRGHTHHALMPFAILHSEYESTHWQYFAPYSMQKPGFLEE